MCKPGKPLGAGKQRRPNRGSGRLRRIGLSVLPVLAGLLGPRFAAAQAPSDFTVTARGGGVQAAHEVHTVVVDAAGGEFCRTAFADRATGACTDTAPVALSPAQLDSLWEAVQVNGFFALDTAYVSTEWADGTWAELTVTGDAATHRVATQNTAVFGFDAILSALNGMLPPEQRIVTIETLP